MSENNGANGEQQHNERGLTTRRSVLGALGTSAIGSVLLTGTSRAAAPASAVRLQGSYDNPVSMAEIHQARQRVAKKAVSRGVKGYANPGFPDQGRIVEYVVAPRGTGVPRQFVGVAGNSASVSGVRSRADTKEAEFNQTLSTTTITDGSFSTQQTGNGWNPITPSDDEGYYEEAPYGAVQNNFDWWKLENSQEESGRNMHSIRQYHHQTPGKIMSGSEYDGSEWQNEYARDKHWWNRGEQTSPELKDWDPQQKGSGEYSVTIGTSTEPLSWSFPINNTDFHDNTDFTTPKVDLKFQIWGNQYREDTMSFEPGSRCEVNEHSCGEYDLLEFRSYAGMQNELDLSRNGLYFDWTLWWDFGSC